MSVVHSDSDSTQISASSGRPKAPTTVLALPLWFQLDLGYEPEATPPVSAEDSLSWLDEITSGFGAPLEELPATTWQPLEPPPPVTTTEPRKAPLPPPPATEPAASPFPSPSPSVSPGPAVDASDDVLAALDRPPKERLATKPGDATHIDVLEILEGERRADHPANVSDLPADTNIDILAVLDAETPQPVGTTTPPPADAAPASHLPGPETDTDLASDAEQIASILAVLGADPTILRPAGAPSGPEATQSPTGAAPPTQLSRRSPEASPPSPESPAAVEPVESPLLTDESTSVIVSHLANQIPDDPDEAIAWLERMAQESARRPARSPRTPPKPITLPFEAGNRLEPARPARPVVENDIPDNLDDALAWLDELVADDARREALQDPTDIIEPLTPLVAAALPEPPEALPPIPSTPPIALSDEVNEALAWLDQLAAQDSGPIPTLADDTEPGSTGEGASVALSATQAALTSGDIEALVAVYDSQLQEATALDDVIQQVQGALAQYPQAIPLYRVLGDAQQRQGDVSGAAATYRQALLQALEQLL